VQEERSAPRARSGRARAIALASKKKIARKVRCPKGAARYSGKLRLCDLEPNDAWVVQPRASTHLYELTFARGDNVTSPLHIPAVGHGDHDARPVGECNHGGVVVPSTLASDVMDHREWRREPRKGAHQGIGEDSVYASHEAREVHGGTLLRTRGLINEANRRPSPAVVWSGSRAGRSAAVLEASEISEAQAWHPVAGSPRLVRPGREAARQPRGHRAPAPRQLPSMASATA
jgi:hypothetical protein